MARAVGEEITPTALSVYNHAGRHLFSIFLLTFYYLFAIIIIEKGRGKKHDRDN